MKYPQHNPLPVPLRGKYGRVTTTMETVFDWHYELKRSRLMDLYEKGKANTWNATELDWSIVVDFEKLEAERRAMGGVSMFNQLLAPPRPLDDKEVSQLNVTMNAFLLSQFLHGEQGALLASAKIVDTVPWAEAKFYAANQVADEARHVEVYHRYLTEKLGVSFEVHPSLAILLDDIMSDSRWDITYLGMQIMVEGLALAAFGVQRMMMSGEPLIVDITGRIMADESRHVAFGVISLEEVYKDMTSTELREREDFVMEATHLLRERLMMHPVFERLGWPLDVWEPWVQNTPFMRGFRQMLFSKIVPNLKRLGLLTPRVREMYAGLDLLRFEHLKDSVEDPEIAPPEELVQTLMQFLAASSNPPQA